MKLIVGLGNPGPEYQGTRHNVGFRIVDELARQLRVTGQKHISGAVTAQAQFKGETIMLAKPLTYMNLSGTAIKSLVARYKTAAGDLMVVLDDMDLELGKIRIKPGGGSGGHKGLQSAIDSLGYDDFPRLRFGIGRPQRNDVVDFVLSRFEPEEEELAEHTVARAVEALKFWIALGIKKTMNKYN